LYLSINLFKLPIFLSFTDFRHILVYLV